MDTPRSSTGMRSTVAVGAVVALALLTVLAAWTVGRSERDAADDERDAQLRQAAAVTERAVVEPAAALAGTPGLLGADDRIDYDSLQRWGVGALLDSNLRAVAYAPRIDGDERSEFERSVAHPIVDLVRPGEFTPAPDRAEYWPVALVTPDTEDARVVLGLDLRGQPERSAVLQQAVQAGTARLSPPIAGAGRGDTIVSLYQPLYDDEGQVVGVVSGTMSAADMLARIRSQLPEDTRLRVTDGSTVVLATPDEPDDGVSTTLPVAGREWQVAVGVGATNPSQVPLVLLGGGALTLGVALFFLYAARRDRRDGRHLAAMASVTSAVAVAQSPEDVAHAACTSLAASLDADLVWIAVVDDDAERLVTLATSGAVTDAPAEFQFLPLAPTSPTAAAVLEGRRQIAADVSAWAERFPLARPVLAAEQIVSAMAQPLAAGKLRGVLALGYRHRTAFEPDELVRIEHLAGLVAEALARARSAEFERDAVAVLQHALLPVDSWPEAGLDIAVRYAPALERLELGGDWYEIFDLPDGRVALVAGDAVGRGVGAAAVMGQVRSGLRALAAGGDAPALVLAQLDGFAAAVDEGFCTTAVYGVFDPQTHRFCYSSAGHVPPLLCEPDAPPRLLEGGRGLPLGVVTEGAERSEEEVELVPGSILVLYTDGLVERRGQSIDRGFDVLASIVEAHRDLPVEELADVLLRSVPGAGDDDTALVCVRVPYDRSASITVRLGPDLAELSGLRERLDAWLLSRGVDDAARAEVVLCADEAAANAIEHGAVRGGGRSVVVEALLDGDDLRLTVRDQGRWQGRVPSDKRGRGLAIMERLMDDVVIDTDGAGTVVRLHRRLPVAVH